MKKMFIMLGIVAAMFAGITAIAVAMHPANCEEPYGSLLCYKHPF
jgi:fumarate reductase subunit D